MIIREHRNILTSTIRRAIYSPCERYRYRLQVIWDKQEKPVNFLLLNPSTATELQDDPTVVRCLHRAQGMKCGGLIVTNIFALRATDPRELKMAGDPIGPENDAAIKVAAYDSSQVICGWGTHGRLLHRAHDVKRALDHADVLLYTLGLTADGHPRHPLYLPYSATPKLWRDRT